MQDIIFTQFSETDWFVDKQQSTTFFFWFGQVILDRVHKT